MQNTKVFHTVYIKIYLFTIIKRQNGYAVYIMLYSLCKLLIICPLLVKVYKSSDGYYSRLDTFKLSVINTTTISLTVVIACITISSIVFTRVCKLTTHNMLISIKSY